MSPDHSPKSTGPALAAALIAALVAPSSAGRATASDAAIPPPAAVQAVDFGLENVSADSLDGVPRIAFENRRYRHTVDVLGRLQSGPGPLVAIERRLGLAAAAVTVQGQGDSTAYRVRYPSDPDFPGEPRGAVAEPTSRSLDLLLRPVFNYEFGHITTPVQVRIQLEPLARYNPWPGARATASMLIPVYTQFDFDPTHPDVKNVRPGVLTLEQFAWLPRAALVSGTAGLLGDNRYGTSVGAARPFMGGRFLADGQLDLTGSIAFESSGISYSSPRQWSGFAGISWYLPVFDAVARVRGGQFLYGDRGAHFEFRRSFGDFEYALFVLRSVGQTVEGVRVTVPVPPLTRATRQPVRVQPIERFSVNYRTNATPLGTFVSGVASREDYLRELSEPALDANRYRLDRDQKLHWNEPDSGLVPWVNQSGMTGFIFTPWADVLPNRTITLDYNDIPAKWSYAGRGQFVNQTYTMTVGLLPRIEASVRITRMPGAFGFLEDVDNVITTNTDHEASGRLVLLTPRQGVPGLAVGIDDIRGTRYFHSTYAVAGMPLKIKLMQTRFSFGYAPRVFTATRYVLDGGFGAFEVSPWRVVAARVEYDSEKWNVGVGVVLPSGLRLRVAALNLETLSVGAGWTHGL